MQEAWYRRPRVSLQHSSVQRAHWGFRGRNMYCIWNKPYHHRVQSTFLMSLLLSVGICKPKKCAEKRPKKDLKKTAACDVSNNYHPCRNCTLVPLTFKTSPLPLPSIVFWLTSSVSWPFTWGTGRMKGDLSFLHDESVGVCRLPLWWGELSMYTQSSNNSFGSTSDAHAPTCLWALVKNEKNDLRCCWALSPTLSSCRNRSWTEWKESIHRWRRGSA